MINCAEKIRIMCFSVSFSFRERTDVKMTCRAQSLASSDSYELKIHHGDIC